MSALTCLKSVILINEMASYRWSDWTAKCASNLISAGSSVASYCLPPFHNLQIFSFPNPISVLTAVPGWAYQNVAIKGTFDVNVALANDEPESTAVTSSPSSTTSSTSTSTSSSSSTSTSASSTASFSSTPSPTSSSPHTGAIAGGVVGGVIGVALLGLIAFLWRRHLARERKSTQNGAWPITGAGTYPSTGGETPLMKENFRQSDALSPTAQAYGSQRPYVSLRIPYFNSNCTFQSVMRICLPFL